MQQKKKFETPRLLVIELSNAEEVLAIACKQFPSIDCVSRQGSTGCS